MAFHGITGARYRTAGSSGAYTDIENIGAESGIEYDDPEGVKTPEGANYWGGRKATATVQHVDATRHAALETLYKANGRIELQLDLVGGDQPSITGLCTAMPESVKGAAGGARGYMLKVIGFTAA